MDWTTVALIAIGAIVLLGIIAATAWFLIARAAMKNFKKVSDKMDRDFRDFDLRRHGRF